MKNNVDMVSKYMTIRQWVLTFGYIPECGIRHLIFSNEKFNKRVVKRIGTKVLLDVRELENWVEEQNEEQCVIDAEKKQEGKGRNYLTLSNERFTLGFSLRNLKYDLLLCLYSTVPVV